MAFLPSLDYLGEVKSGLFLSPPQRDVVRDLHIVIREGPNLRRVVDEADPHQVGLWPVVDQELGDALALGGLQPDELLDFEDHFSLLTVGSRRFMSFHELSLVYTEPRKPKPLRLSGWRA